MYNLRQYIRKLLIEHTEDEIKKHNSEVIKKHLSDTDIYDYITKQLFDNYISEVGIETILNFIKVEDKTNWRIQVGHSTPGTINFAEKEIDNPDENEIDKIIRKNKIPYTKEQIKNRLIQYFMRRYTYNIPTDKYINSKDDVVAYTKMYGEKFLYEYLIPISTHAKYF